MKRKIIIVSIILIVLITCVIFIKGKYEQNNLSAENNLLNTTRTIYKVNDETYTYNLHDNNIVIKYPILNSDKVNLMSVNNLIKETALNFFKVNEKFKQSVSIDYNIKYKNDTLISIIFSVLSNSTPSAHPKHLFYTLNIDLKNNVRVKLTDIYIIDDYFIELFKKELQKQIQSEIVTYILENYDDKELKEMLNNADKENSGVFSYFTNTSVGISFPTIFALGDHLEIEINKELLNSKLK